MINYENIQVKDYIKLHEDQQKKYGVNTLVLMQVGSFHEMYCTDNEGPLLHQIAEELDVICTRKNKKKPTSVSNPYMLGFPSHSLSKFVDILVKKQYTLVIVDQVSEPPKPVRKITKILTPSTYIESKNNVSQNYGNYLISLIIEKGINLSKNESVLVGISAIDLTRGKIFYHEGISKNYDSTFSLDDACRFLQRFPPSEVIWSTTLKDKDEKINKMKLSEIIEYLSLPKTTNEIDYSKIKPLAKISFQKKKFQELFNIEIDELDNLDIWSTARLSLMLGFYYIERINDNLLRQLEKPRIFANESNLHLGNKSLKQLNFLDPEGILKVIDKTRTIMGKRFLLENLSSPLTDSGSLLKRYDDIKYISKSSDDLRKNLDNIYDLDKINRKLGLETIFPDDIYKLVVSLENILSLENTLNTELSINFDIFTKGRQIYQKINNTFDPENILSLNNLEVRKSFFKKNVVSEIDDIQTKLDSLEECYDRLCVFLGQNLEEGKFIKGKSFIKLERNTVDGIFLSLTQKRALKIKETLSSNKKFEIEGINLNNLDKMLDFTIRNKTCKIKGLWFENKFKEKVDLENQLVILIKEKYKDFIIELKQFTNDIKQISEMVAYLDFINSGSIIMNNYHYCLPVIKEKEESYFKATNIRHPLVERISENEYIPQNVSLGKKLKGIVLYGVNSSGKSTLMKSIGINIILAQIGYPVSAEKFVYSPYYSIFTRILGNDNIYSGLSSFMVEMIELNAILNRNNKNTLVIADELCRGTEIDSANVIVVYMLEQLAKNNASFISASHLHQIMSFDSIKKLDTIKAYHLSVKYHKNNLIYNRELKEGQGNDFYGLEIAKYIIEDENFSNRTLELTNKLESLKTSKYNSKLVLEKCELCDSKDTLETHHIVFQKEFNKKLVNKNKFHLVKNDLNNLVCLCQKCHDDIDRNKIKIKKWVNNHICNTE